MMTKPVLTAISAAALVGMLAGCANLLKDPYQRPAFELPPSFVANESANQPSNTALTIDWVHGYRAFKDPVLDALLQEAEQNSQSLKLAAARIEEANSSLSTVQASRYPTVDLNATATRQRYSQTDAYVLPVTYSNQHELSLTANYDVDFWGKFANADEAARARLLGSQAAQGTVLSTLYASVAQSYFALRALDAEVVLQKQLLAIQQEALRLQTARFHRGIASQTDVLQAQANVMTATATLRSTEQNLRTVESALALLLGRSPAAIAQPKIERGADIGTLYTTRNDASVWEKSLPSELLNRRPDVIASEQELIATNAEIGEARAAYFPSINLTATGGKQSQALSSLYRPTSTFWTAIASLAQPIFRGGAIKALVQAATAKQKEALAQYIQTVQGAFRDVHDALSNLDAQRDITASFSGQTQALQSATHLAELRDKAGSATPFELLAAEQNSTQAQITFIENQRAELNAIVNLYQVLGGGWDSNLSEESKVRS